MESKQTNPITIPGAIIIAAAIIAIAIIWTNKPASSPSPSANPDGTAKNAVAIKISPVTGADHILGNPNAEIKIVEFSDASCPFCKTFHPYMHTVMEEYGPLGQVAWVYRHFPLDKPDAYGRVLHPNANREAQAMECAAELGGNTSFWAYADRLYEVTPSVTQQSPNGLNPSELPKIADYIELDVERFNDCLNSNRYDSKVKAHYLDGVNAGVSGTPYSVFVLPSPAKDTMDKILSDISMEYRLPQGALQISDDRLRIGMSGAMPVAVIKRILDSALSGN